MIRRVRRTKVQLRCEVVAFCQSPQFMSDIIRKMGINHMVLMRMVDAGFLVKFDECRDDWVGPLAHRYVAVNNP